MLMRRKRSWIDMTGCSYRKIVEYHMHLVLPIFTASNSVEKKMISNTWMELQIGCWQFLRDNESKHHASSSGGNVDFMTTESYWCIYWRRLQGRNATVQTTQALSSKSLQQSAALCICWTSLQGKFAKPCDWTHNSRLIS